MVVLVIVGKQGFGGRGRLGGFGLGHEELHVGRRRAEREGQLGVGRHGGANRAGEPNATKEHRRRAFEDLVASPL
jgi:hypothetical protein